MVSLTNTGGLITPVIFLCCQFLKIMNYFFLENLWDGPLQKALSLQRVIFNMTVDPEEGLPNPDEMDTLVGHIRTLIRGYGELLKKAHSLPDLKKLYNNLSDATCILLQNWGRNRDKEVGSLEKRAYLKGKKSREAINCE